jgi:hypothetical protein
MGGRVAAPPEGEGASPPPGHGAAPPNGKGAAPGRGAAAPLGGEGGPQVLRRPLVPVGGSPGRGFGGPFLRSLEGMGGSAPPRDVLDLLREEMAQLRREIAKAKAGLRVGKRPRRAVWGKRPKGPAESLESALALGPGRLREEGPDPDPPDPPDPPEPPDPPGT